MGQSYDSSAVRITNGDEMMRLVEARRKEEEEQMGKLKDQAAEDDIDSDFIRKCLYENELGDGNLFKRLYRKDFVYNKAMGSWLYWTGHHWEVDQMDYALASVDGVARVYFAEAKSLSKKIRELEAQNNSAEDLKAERKLLLQRVSALRSSRRRINCLTFAHTSENALAVMGTELDSKPWLLPCANGVLNLKTGELEQGRQEDMLLKASPVTWEGIDVPCPVWEQALMEIFSDNEPLVRFLQRISGYALVGEVVQSILVVMTGRGRNGKSMIVGTLAKVLGPLSGAIRSEMLLDQYRVASSAGPTPDIMALRGLRMAFASETDDGCKISPARVKWLTGNDTISGRNPHDKYEVQFRPSHTLFLQTNHKPHAPADDYAFWERVLLMPFEMSFVDREPRTDYERRADPLLSKKLDEELPGIFAWVVRGCLDWQANGLQPPPIVKEAVQEYQRNEDLIADFIDECCVVGPDCSVGATAVYLVFEKWWLTNVSNKPPKQKGFGTLFCRRFERVKEGNIKYLGVGLLAPDDSLPDFGILDDDY